MLDLLQQWSQTLDVGKGLAEFFLARTVLTQLEGQMAGGIMHGYSRV